MVEEPLLCFCLIIYRELKKLNSPKINEPIKKWATELNRTFQRKKFTWPKNI
jgi:hypothetical protein